MGLVVLFFLAGIMGIICGVVMGGLLWWIMGIAGISLGLFMIADVRKVDKYRAEQKVKEEDEKQEYKRLSEEFEVPQSAKIVHSSDRMQAYMIWLSDGFLKLFPDLETFMRAKKETYKIRVDDILFYCIEGAVTANVTGSGGHSSFSPLTGFHGKTNPIEIKTTERDSRRTELHYGMGNVLYFDAGDFATFKRVIPMKDIAVVQGMQVEEAKKAEQVKGKRQSANRDVPIEERLAKLEKLKQADLLTEDEYKSQKAKILETL